MHRFSIDLSVRLVAGILFAGCSGLSTADRICPSSANLQCLRANYAKFTESQYQEFWAILSSAAASMADCKKASDVKDFMELVSLNPRSADLDEFLSEKIERLVVKDPTCALKGIQGLTPSSRSLVLQRLRRPDFVEESQIRKVFSDAQSSSAFKALADDFFSLPAQ